MPSPAFANRASEGRPRQREPLPGGTLVPVCTMHAARPRRRDDDHLNRVTEGAEIDIGHHYEAMSRKEFRLEEVSPVAHRPAT